VGGGIAAPVARFGVGVVLEVIMRRYIRECLGRTMIKYERN